MSIDRCQYFVAEKYHAFQVYINKEIINFVSSNPDEPELIIEN